MIAKVRSVDFLPEIFQTPVNKQFLSATLDQLIQEPAFKKSEGYIGRRVGPGINPADNYVIEPTASRNNYQLEPGVISIDNATDKIKDAITYPGIIDAIATQGGVTNKADRLFESEYYSWDPFVDFDKFVNYSQYYWIPGGPDAVTVSPTAISAEETITVVRNPANNAYTFSGINVTGNNPTITLARGGQYQFNIAQNNTVDIEFRVTNNSNSSWVINYQNNPSLTLVRGNTYTFNLTQTIPYKFYIKTALSFGTTNLYNNGVLNNGIADGLITFTVPQDAPDTLYYCNDDEFNLRGQFNIVNAEPGNGPKFWIQTFPGVEGRNPYSPNISTREIFGVANNGIDLGTITFNVPSGDAQNVYTSMPILEYPANSGYTNGTVDLVTNLLYDQINGISTEAFFAANPTGIDGITNLNGRTLIFSTQFNDPEAGGWYNNTPFDPLLPGNNFNVGAYDTTTYDQSEPITNQAIQFSVWQVQYLIDSGGTEFIRLNSIQTFNELTQCTITFGTQWCNTQWYKNFEGFFERQPAITAPLSTLYYQDAEDPLMFGEIQLIDENLDVYIDVTTDILGQTNYTSPNGVVFTNGLKVEFTGAVYPTSYQGNSYYVYGVGTGIVLCPVTNFVTPETYIVTEPNPYDSTPYDIGAFDSTANEPLTPQYMTISMSSPDLNSWTRANRWFHVDVIAATAAYNNTSPTLINAQRAKRPILEFRAGTHLFNSGTEGIPAVNVIDFEQTDALSNVNGKPSYTVDGFGLTQGTYVIFAADQDPVVRKTVYLVNLVSFAPGATPLIELQATSYSPVLENQTTVCLSGVTLQGLNFYYNGTTWVQGQQKTQVNQPPLFDVYNSNGISFGNTTTYPSTNFVGCKLLSYAENASNEVDPILDIPLAYYSIENIGSILFDNNLYTDTFIYTPVSAGITVDVSSGFVRQYSDRTTYELETGWQTAVIPSLPRQQFRFSYDGQPLQLDVLAITTLAVPPVQIFINSVFQLPSTYTVGVNPRSNTTVITLNGTYATGDIVEVLVLSEQVSTQGFYQVPVNLENNPFNANSRQFTLGTARTHYESICQNLTNLQGPINGANNSRDLGDIIPYGTQILQQSSPLTLAGYFLRSTDYNVFAAIEYNSRQYIKYKNKLLTAVTQLDIQPGQTVASILDQAILSITQNLTSSDPFYWSDMLPAGTNYTTSSTTVNPLTTNTFNTTQMYDFTQSNYLGLLVYLNNELLVRDRDYVVSTEAPKLTITVTLAVGDVVTINEYPTTVGNWCPNTPSKMGLYPKYRPEIFLDDTYSEPTTVIQGHDGSITIAFGDIRDEVLLEFEKRIYDNIKLDDNPIPLSTDNVNPTFYPAQTTALLPGYFRTTPYTYQEINTIMSESFLSWVGQNKLDYTAQTYVADNPFTYNYSQAGNRIDQAPFLQGNWRGIYRYFYDTETPNTTPWEMLGFTEQPAWWELRYGPAPYTGGNRVLWDDLEAGLVADPAGPYVLPEYIRLGLSNIIPSGVEGELLPPTECVVGKYDPTAFQKSWVAGDGGPVQAAWWNSSSFPFAMMRMLALTKPAQFFSLFADRDLYRYDTTLGQYLYNQRYRLDANGVEVYGNGTSKASYINWIVDYNRQTGIDSTQALTTDLSNLDVRLCYRMASFSDSEWLNVFTERSSPGSTNNSLLLTSNSYNVLMYKNQPFDQLVYSSVVIEVTQLGTGGIGYSVFGFSNIQPYFNIQVSSPVGLYQTITSGNLSVEVPTQYTQNTRQIPYGYVFTTPASVCDFLLSYGKYLETQGLIFDDRENGYTLDWNQMAQEFLYFASQGWTPSTIINLNPVATTIKATKPISIVDTIATVSQENMLVDQNRQPLDVRKMIVRREGNAFSITSTNNQSISYLTLRFTNYEDMIVFNNTSQYNDLIYDPATAARQSRLKLSAYTSTEWDGQLNAQGFILNENNVKQWESYKKYAKGEIVLYKNTYWQALTIVQPKEKFVYADWTKSNYQAIDQGLLPNLANKANQLANTYDIYQANLDIDNDLFAFNLIGFNPRQYMTNMNLDDSTQVQVYQQFIGTKGTRLAAQVFGRANLGKESGQYNVYENWGILAGTYGAQANKSFIELVLNQSKLSYNPSTVQVVMPGESSQANQTVLVNDIWKESYRITSPDIFPTTYETSNTPTALPTAGYVSLDDVDLTVFNINDPTTLNNNINSIGVGTYIWIAKINSYNWGVYRAGEVPGRMTSLTNNLDNTSIAQFSAPHGLVVGDLIIVKYFNQGVNGVYRVLSVPSISSITIQYTFTNTNVTTITGTGIVFELQSARVGQASDIATVPYVNNLLPGAKVWVDNNSSGLWETVEKQEPFTSEVTFTSPLDISSLYGSATAQTTNNSAILVGAPGDNKVSTYFKDISGVFQYNNNLTLDAADAAGFGNAITVGNQTWMAVGANTSDSGVGYVVIVKYYLANSNFVQTQLLVPPVADYTTIAFGSSLAMSADETWLYVGAPGNNTVYAYQRVVVTEQSVTYTTNWATTEFNWADTIEIDNAYPDQLLVVLGETELVEGVDYTLTSTDVVFGTPPAGNQQLILSRRLEKEITYSAAISANDYLYTATTIENFTVRVNDQLQRPGIDYTFNTSTTAITFTVTPTAGDIIILNAGDSWQLVESITNPDSEAGDQFGSSVTTTTDGSQVMIGASQASVTTISPSTNYAGAAYVYDRSVQNFVVTDASQMSYTYAGTAVEPITVSVNGTYLLSTDQSTIRGQYSVSGSTVTLTNITLSVSDVISIGTNQFTLIQTVNSSTPTYEAQFGTTIAACPLNCSIYVGAPYDSTYVPQAGSVDHLTNQSRVYGVTTSMIANPTLTVGDTLRINNIQVSVPAVNNNVSGFAAAINAANIANVIATTTPDLEFVGDGSTKQFNIGNLYSAVESYTPVVLVNGSLQTLGADYTYNNTTQTINFIYAPYVNSVITVVSGRLVISVQNAQSATPFNMLTVLPGTDNSVFDELGFETFVTTQQIVSPAPTQYALFGSSISVDSSAVNLIVGAPNGNVYEATTFDSGQTYFDERSTTFYNPINNGGVAYTYDYFPSSTRTISNPGQFAFGQQIYNSNTVQGDAFGTSASYVNGVLIVGALGNNSTSTKGYATVFVNPTNAPSWQAIRVQQPVADVWQLDGVFSYDKTLNSTQTYFDFINPLQGKILGTARRNIDYIGAVDPADYNAGSVHNNGNRWGSEHVGEIWWDTDTVRFIDPNQDDIVYASRRWGTTFPGSRVDIYQWVESTVPPSSYTGPGVPLSTISFTVGSALGQNNFFTTLYYFWVRGITTIATGSGKTLSPVGIANYIADPRSSGLPYIAALDASTIALYNAQSLLSADNTVLNIGFDRKYNNDNVHQEYELIADGIADSFLNDTLYRKMLDSFCGVDTAGNIVPDPMLTPGMRYGVQFRPRQSMFDDRFLALQNYLTHANNVLKQFPITETRSFNLLNASEPKPQANTGAWNKQVPNLETLGYQNLSLVAVGYRYLVDSDSSQDGRWTVYEVVLVSGTKTLQLAMVQSYDTPLYWYYINWYQPGYNSSTAPVAAVQTYGQLGSLSYTTAPIGSSVRVINNGAGKWEIYLRTGTNAAQDWTRVGLEDGTIAFSEKLWDYAAGNFGFDAEVFDSQYFDETPQTETRYVLRAINEELYVDDLQIERNRSLILMFNYVYTEFTDPSWLIKTSLVDVNHNIRTLEPYQTYLQDNQNFVLDYFNEVKPYHTQVRQFNLIYSGLDTYQGDVCDYDLPAFWNDLAKVPQFTSPILLPYDQALTPNQSSASDFASDSQVWLTAPYNQWYNNYLLDIESVFITNPGYGYRVAPIVTVTGTCVTPLQLTVTINGVGRIVSVNVVSYGSGYSTEPIITLSGGGFPNDTVEFTPNLVVISNTYITARAGNIYQVVNNGTLGAVAPTHTEGTELSGDVELLYVGTVGRLNATVGNNLVRGIRTVIKYDRYQYTTAIAEWESGTTYLNGTQVRYRDQVWQANNTSGPSPETAQFDYAQWELVAASTLSGVDRTMGYYVPTATTPGLSLPLLVGGVEYPGVQVTGVSFAQDTGFARGGFDINPYDNYVLLPNGTVTFDLNILDTVFESSYDDIYLGTRATDINIDGGAYVDTYSSYAPEELMPGITYDTMDFRVYTTPGGDWQGVGHGFPQVIVPVTYATGTDTYSFADALPYPVTIAVTNTTPGVQIDLVQDVDYTVDWIAQEITVLSGVTDGDTLSIRVFELGGGNQLSKNVYPGTITDSVVVTVPYDLVVEFAIFVNGVYLPDTEYTYVDNTLNQYGTVLITFDSTYTDADYINITPIGTTTIDGVSTDYSWSIPVTQTIEAVTGTLEYDLDNSLEYTNPVNAIVTVDGERVTSGAGTQYIGNGVTRVFAGTTRLGLDQIGSDYTDITDSDVLVYLNDILQESSEYTLTTTTTSWTVTLVTAPAPGAIVYVATTYNAQVKIDTVTNRVVFDSTVSSPATPLTGELIQVTTWNDTREQRLVTQVFVGPEIEDSSYGQGYDATTFDEGSVDFEEGSFDYSKAIDSFTCNTTAGSDVLTNVSSFYGIELGEIVSGSGITFPSYVDSFDEINGTITISQNATLTQYNITVAQSIPFTCDLTNGSTVLTNVSSFVGITVGEVVVALTPLFNLNGTTTATNISYIESFDELAGTITLRDPANTTQNFVTLNHNVTYAENSLSLAGAYTDPERLWVTLNGKILTPVVDYYIQQIPEPWENENNYYVILTEGVLQTTDVVIITQVTETVVPEAMAFRIFKDMRGLQLTYRITPPTTTTVVLPVTAGADVIYVANASALPEPDFAANQWGVVTINGERIMYRERDLLNNSISSLLRGTAGTGASSHAVGSLVYDMSRDNLLPLAYQDHIVGTTELGDGTTTVFEAPDINLGQ